MRRGLDALNRRDKDAFLALCDPSLANVPPRDWPESEPIRGADSVFDFLAVEAQNAWGAESSSFQYVEFIDAGTNAVVARMEYQAVGKASGAHVAFSYWQSVTFRDGKVLRIEWFGDRAEAIEAARGAA